MCLAFWPQLPWRPTFQSFPTTPLLELLSWKKRRHNRFSKKKGQPRVEHPQSAQILKNNHVYGFYAVTEAIQVKGHWSQNIGTGWSRETVNCNISLTDLKNIKIGITQSFLERVHREVLIFLCLIMARWQKVTPFRALPNLYFGSILQGRSA